MDRFPSDFADLLTPKGRRILDGRRKEAAAALVAERPFLFLDGMVDRDRVEAAARLLERAMAPLLEPMIRAIPFESITGQTRNHQERLIKTVRVRTAWLERRGSRAFDAAERIGLVAMTRSDAWRGFAEAVSGRALDPRSGVQVLRYGPGDYSGPHTDHYPEDARARAGYVDLHLSLGCPGAARQFLVYASRGHFSEMVDVNRQDGIAVYRLPFWHYTTPLAPLPGHERDARRWVVLGTFLYARGA